MGPGRVFASCLEISGPGLFLGPEPELPEFLSSSEAYPELPAVRGSRLGMCREELPRGQL